MILTLSSTSLQSLFGGMISVQPLELHGTFCWAVLSPLSPLRPQYIIRGFRKGNGRSRNCNTNLHGIALQLVTKMCLFSVSYRSRCPAHLLAQNSTACCLPATQYLPRPQLSLAFDSGARLSRTENASGLRLSIPFRVSSPKRRQGDARRDWANQQIHSAEPFS